MIFLVDACALIVFHGYGGATMGPATLDIMRTADLFVSPITVWEITRKAALGKLPRPTPAGYEGSFASWLATAGYRVMPLTWEDCERANALPAHHKDPMDRMLIATALAQDFTIVTDDGIFPRYGVKTIW